MVQDCSFDQLIHTSLVHLSFHDCDKSLVLDKYVFEKDKVVKIFKKNTHITVIGQLPVASVIQNKSNQKLIIDHTLANILDNDFEKLTFSF